MQMTTTITGTVLGNYSSVTVNGQVVTVSSTGYFQANIALVTGQNTVTVIANGILPCATVTKLITIGCNPICQNGLSSSDFTGTTSVNVNTVTFNGTYNTTKIASLKVTLAGIDYPVTLNANGTWTLVVNNLTHGMNYVATITATPKDGYCTVMTQTLSFSCAMVCLANQQITTGDYTT